MPILDVDVDIAKSIYDVNVWGVVRTTQVFAPLVIAAQGTIVIIGSLAGAIPYVFGGNTFPILHTNLGAYNSSKAAGHAISDALRLERYPFKVKVINVCTGGVKTLLTQKSIQKHDLKLPHDSLYMPIEEGFKKRQGYSNKHATTSEEFARQVVSAINGARKSGWLWK